MSHLLDVGARCGAANCLAHDFLPIACYCDNYFCAEHIAPDAHSCQFNPAALNPTATGQKLETCELCTKTRLPGDGCPNCKKTFCPYHRHPISHPCIQNQSTSVNHAARALLAKFPAKKSAPQAKPPPKTSAKLELLKMRHHAVPVDPKDSSLPVDQRHYFKVKLNDVEKLFWARKEAVTGKVLDLISVQFQMLSSPLEMLKCPTHDLSVLEPVQYSQPFSTQVEDGSLLIVREKKQ